ncbi:hypothetical protein F5X98DRAFT_371210 [Xylaria grammica]|nr:hypothetical protein F5X98DRAFT_371210 [Xylaria grammica]
MDYAPANFQNNTAGYYDVLNVSLDANKTEITQGYIAQLLILRPFESDITRDDGSLNLTILAKVEEVKKAHRILSNDVGRCVYDFDYLHTGIWKYLRCLFNARVRPTMGALSVSVWKLNWRPRAAAPYLATDQ